MENPIIYDKIDEFKQGIVSIQNGVYENIRKNNNIFINREVTSPTTIAAVSGKGVLKYLIINCHFMGGTGRASVNIDGKTFNFSSYTPSSGITPARCGGILARESIIGSNSASGLEIEGSGTGVSIDFDNCSGFQKLSSENGVSGSNGQMFLTETGLKFNNSLNISVSQAGNGLYVYGLYVLED